jgi:hypothetical protein
VKVARERKIAYNVDDLVSPVHNITGRRLTSLHLAQVIFSEMEIDMY